MTKHIFEQDHQPQFAQDWQLRFWSWLVTVGGLPLPPSLPLLGLLPRFPWLKPSKRGHQEISWPKPKSEIQFNTVLRTIISGGSLAEATKPRKEIVLADRNFLLRRSMSKYWGGSCCKSKALARVSKEVGPSRSRSSGTRPFRAHLTLTADKTSEQNLFSELYISCRQGLIVWLQHILWTMLKLTLMQMQMQANRRHQPKLFQDYMHHKTGAKWGW